MKSFDKTIAKNRKDFSCGEVVRKRIQEKENPDYITSQGRFLWVDSERYDDFSVGTGCKVLVDYQGKFWGYSTLLDR